MIIERLESRWETIVPLAELKNHLRVSHDDEDFDLQRMVFSAAREAEDLAQIALLSQAVRVTLKAWPEDRHALRLPIGPLMDTASISLTAGGEDYESFTASTGLRPTIRLTGPRPCGPIEIEYIAGYGETGALIPDDLKLAIIDQAANHYDNRGGLDDKAHPQSPHFARIIGRYRGVSL